MSFTVAASTPLAMNNCSAAAISSSSRTSGGLVRGGRAGPVGGGADGRRAGRMGRGWMSWQNPECRRCAARPAWPIWEGFFFQLTDGRSINKMNPPRISHAPPMLPARQLALAPALRLGTFITVLDISIVNVALPTLHAALDTDIAGLQWVVDAYALCLSAFMLSAGPLGDRYGRRRAWLGGVALFMLGSALCAAATGLPLL